MQRGTEFKGACCDIVLLHAGVNNVTKGAEPFAAGFRVSFEYAVAAIATLFHCKVVCSTVCLTRSDRLNLRVAEANTIIREEVVGAGWVLASHDNVRVQDLADEVHLNAGGVAKLYRTILGALRQFLPA